MKGLLIKDLSVLLRQMRIFLLMILLFTVVPGTNLTVFAVVYAALMPYTAMAYDERSHWDQLAAAMPYRTWELVASKYVLGWLFTGCAALVALAASAAERRFTSAAGSPASGIFASFCVGVLLLALTLPPMFRFGVEKGRMLFLLVVIVLACGSAGLVGGLLDSGVKNAAVLLTVLPLAAAAATALSIPLSVRLYGRRSL